MSKYYSDLYCRYRENVRNFEESSPSVPIVKDLLNMGVPKEAFKADILAYTYDDFSSVSFDQEDLEKISLLFRGVIYDAKESIGDSHKRVFDKIKKHIKILAVKLLWQVMLTIVYILLSVYPIFYLVPIIWSGIAIIEFCKNVKEEKVKEKKLIEAINEHIGDNEKVWESVKNQLNRMKAQDASYEAVLESRDKAKALVEQFLTFFQNDKNKVDKILDLINSLNEIDSFYILEFVNIFNKIAFYMTEQELYDLINRLDENTLNFIMNNNEFIVLREDSLRDRFISLKRSVSLREYLFELSKMAIYLSNKGVELKLEM